MFGLELTAALLAVVTAVWAGFLGLAEESPDLTRPFTGSGIGLQEPISLQREFQISRLALLLISAASAGVAVGWWYHRPIVSAATALMLMGFLFLVGETLPRIAGHLVPSAASAVTPIARRTLIPFRLLFGWIALNERALRKVFPVSDNEGPDLDAAQRDMVVGVFALKETTVEEIMTPRLDISAVDHASSWSELVGVLRRSEHGRLPVYRDNLDNIAGIIYAKDLVPAVAGVEPVPDPWQDVVRPAQFVPETKSLDSQLQDFQGRHGNMAIVVDEFGGTSGLVTLEDVIEEIVGEIRDEYDTDEMPAIEREGNDKFWVDGGVSVDELSAAIGVSIDIEDVSTVGGLIYSELGRVPRPGEELSVGDFRVVVEQVVRRRIRRVYFERAEVPRRVSEAE